MSSLRLECYTGLLGPLFTDTHLNLSALFLWGGVGVVKEKGEKVQRAGTRGTAREMASWPH